MRSIKSHSFQTSVTARKHFYQFYRGKEDLFRFVIPFLSMGLRNQEACLWIVSRSIGLPEAIESFQRQHDLTPFVYNRQLVILPAERWYLEGDRFSERKAVQRFRQFVEERRRLGFSAFRVSGDAGWLETHDWMKFQAYESKVHDWIHSTTVTALCAYPIGRCSIIQTKDIHDHHDGIFLTKL